MIRKYVIAIQTDDGRLYRLVKYVPENEVDTILCGYRSRSGAHWINCYDIDGKKIEGWIKIIKRSLIKIMPLPLEELYKRIPKELKNIVGIDTLKSANKELVEALLKYVRDLYGDYAKNFIVIEDTDGVTVALKATVVPKNVYVYRATKVAEQGHLSIYFVHDFNLSFDTTLWVNNIYNHFMEPKYSVNAIAWYRNSIYAVLARVVRPVTITSHDHPEKIVLTPGVYLFTHPVPSTVRD